MISGQSAIINFNTNDFELIVLKLCPASIAYGKTATILLHLYLFQISFFSLKIRKYLPLDDADMVISYFNTVPFHHAGSVL